MVSPQGTPFTVAHDRAAWIPRQASWVTIVRASIEDPVVDQRTDGDSARRGVNVRLVEDKQSGKIVGQDGTDSRHHYYH